MKNKKLLVMFCLLIIAITGCQKNKIDDSINVVDEVILRQDFVEEENEILSNVDNIISENNDILPSKEDADVDIEKDEKLLATYSLDLKRENYYYLSMNLIDDYVYIVRDHLDDKKVQIIGLDLLNLDNDPLKIIYEGKGEKNYSAGYTDCFNKSKDGMIVCNLQQQIVFIDPITHEVENIEKIDSEIIDYGLSHDGKTKSYIKENYNIYIKEGNNNEILIEEGHYIDNVTGAGCGYDIYIPRCPRWSMNDTYLAYNIAGYETTSGPTITDKSGKILIDINSYWDYVGFWWLDDNRLILEDAFCNEYLGVLDMNTFEFSYLIDEQRIISLTCNPYTQTLSVYQEEPYNHLKIFDSNNLKMYTEIPIEDEVYNGHFIFSFKDKVYIIKDEDNKLTIDIYPFEGEVKYIEPRVEKYSKYQK